MQRRHSSAGDIVAGNLTLSGAHDQFGMVPWSITLPSPSTDGFGKPILNTTTPEISGRLAPTPKRAGGGVISFIDSPVTAPDYRPFNETRSPSNPTVTDSFGLVPFEVVVSEGNVRPRPRSELQRRHTVGGGRMKRHIVPLSPMDGNQPIASGPEQSSSWWRQSPNSNNESQSSSSPTGPAMLPTSTGLDVNGGVNKNLDLAPTNPFAFDVLAMSSTDRSSATVPQVSSAQSSRVNDVDHKGSVTTSPVASPSPVQSVSQETAANSGAGPSTQATNSTTSLERHTSNTLERSAQARRVSDRMAHREILQGNAWHFHLKLPGRSTYIPSRSQLSKSGFFRVIVALRDDTLYVHEHSTTLEKSDGSIDLAKLSRSYPMMEVQLQHQVVFTPMERRRVSRESRARLHVIKLQIMEPSQAHRFFAVLSSNKFERRTVLKLGCFEAEFLEGFVEAVMNAVRGLPVELDSQSVYRKNAVTLDVVDSCLVQMAFDGSLVSRLSTVHIMVHAFLTGSPECQLIVNDRELAVQHRNDRTGVVLPVSKHMVDMTHVQLHPSCDQNLFDEHRLIRFKCMQGVRFEAVRFQASGTLPPPIEVRSMVCELIGDVVNLGVKLHWHGQAGKVRHAVRDVEWHFPVPKDWSAILEIRTALGMRRSVNSKTNLRGSFRRKRQTQQAKVDVSAGTAKYEPESSAIVWRIDDLPKAQDAHVSFSCHLELNSEMTHPDFSTMAATLRYNVDGSCISGINVWSLRIPSTHVKPPEKTLNYSTRFRYLVAMQPGMYELATDDD